MMMETIGKIVVLFSICLYVFGCAHKCVFFAGVEVPSMKTLYAVTSERDTLGPNILNTDDKLQVFYTCETSSDQMRTFIRCYDYGLGCKWEREIPLVVGNYALWCVGNEVYIGGNSNVWRGMHQATDLYGCVCLLDFERPYPALKVIAQPESRDFCCREIAGYDDQYLVFLYGPEQCGEEFSSYVIFDPIRHQIVEKKCFADEESRWRILARCNRRGGGCRAPRGKFVKRVTDEGCLIYDNHFSLVSKLSAEAIEDQFLFLDSQGKEFVRKCRPTHYWYNVNFVDTARVVFWNIYGGWFIYDINADRIVDSGVINLSDNEWLEECLGLNCFLVHIRRPKSLQLLTWDFREDMRDLVVIENGKQKRKYISGLKGAWRLTDRIYCLDFQG